MLHLSTALEGAATESKQVNFPDVIGWDQCFIKVREPQETLSLDSLFFCLPVEMNREKKQHSDLWIVQSCHFLFYIYQQTAVRVMLLYFGNCFVIRAGW